MARSGRLESGFQDRLIDILRERFSGCLVFKIDKPGFPDLLILYEDKWAALECKRSRSAVHQPNQDYWVDIMNNMSFAAFIYPENKEEVLYELERAFQA